VQPASERLHVTRSREQTQTSGTSRVADIFIS